MTDQVIDIVMATPDAIPDMAQSFVASWGTFKADTVNLDKVAQHRAAASKLVDETAFDLGPQNSY